MNSRRRNGKPASCEPCRKDKVRCDHLKPVCTRCQKRDIASHCFYHPAPLTRSAARVSEDRRSKSSSLPSRVSYTPRTSSSSSEEPYCPSATDNVLPTGYLGPTSFVATFEEDKEFVSTPNDSRQDGGDSTASPPGLPSYWVQKTAEVLGCLKDFSTIEHIVVEYYNLSQAAVVPAPLILNSVAQIRSSEWLSPAASSSAHTTSILRNTAQSLHIPPSTEGSRFHELFTGSHLRLEVLGVIYAIAGRFCVFSVVQDKLTGSKALREVFSRKMLAASDAVIQICKMLTPVNELTIWMMYENLLLASVVHGDSSSGKWHRLGDLTTHMFELGIHRDPQQLSNLPTFLLESRRRLYAAAYQLDKSIATFLGRPPRISWRHSDCSLPLDLSDETLVADTSDFELASSFIDRDGWNVQSVFQRSAWIRVRYLVSTFREEILEQSLQKPGQEAADQLRDIIFRCHQTWDSLPAHLRYTQDCWDSGLSVGICMMLIASYLSYLYNEFLVQRLLIQQDPEAYIALLGVSSTILSTVLSLGIQREHGVDIQRDFIWIVLLYGFPSVGVLTKALQNQARTGRPIPYQGSRSRLIRDLSVFISHLDSMARPGVTNHEMFARASKVISNIIDEVLDSKVPVASDLKAIPDSVVDSFNISDELNLLDAMDFGVVFDQWIF